MLLDALKGSGNRLAVDSISLSCIGNAFAGACGGLVRVSSRSRHTGRGAGHAMGCFPCHLWPSASRCIANHHTP